MVRPKQVCRVCKSPGTLMFVPRGRKRADDEVCLELDEYEALRLKDLVCIGQHECAEKMGISQSTFHRLLQRARAKVADSIINRKSLKVLDATNAHICDDDECQWKKKRNRCCYESEERRARDER